MKRRVGVGPAGRRAAVPRALAWCGGLLAAVAAVLLLGLARPAPASALPTYIPSVFDQREPVRSFPVRPSRLRFGGPGVNGTLRGIRWRGWGRGSAVGAASMRICPNMAPCERRRVRVRVYRRLLGSCEPARKRFAFYTRLAITQRARPRRMAYLPAPFDAC